MIFYYDETFHDRKITMLSNGYPNIYESNDNDSFVFAILGDRKEKMDKILLEYEKIEKLTKEKLQLEGELKSTTFKRGFFKNGFSTMDKNCKSFYIHFFTFLIENNLKFQMGCISKTEYLIFQFAYALDFPPGIIINSFIYSLTKFVEQHRLYNYLRDLIKGESVFLEKFKSSLIKLLCKFFEEVKGIKREEKEIIAVRQLIEILMVSKVKSNKTICKNWNYDLIAEAVKLRITELNEKNAIVIIDKEPLTLDAFLKNGLNTLEADSKECLGIRMTDMFVGFIGRFIYYLKNDLHESNYLSLEEIERKKFLSKRLINNNWFNLTEEEFSLIRKLGNFFDKATYWSSFTLNYMDDMTLFFSYFHYIMAYKNYEKFCENSNKHNEFFNSYVCESLHNSYIKMNK